MQIAKVDMGRILKLSGELRISAAEDVRVALFDFVCTASSPVLDLSEVTECDAAGLQLLISARRTATGSGKPFELANVPCAVWQAGEALGLPATALLPNPAACTPQSIERDSEDVV